MPARSIDTATLSFGLVAVVELATARPITQATVSR
jgi:hypothetical protein